MSATRCERTAAIVERLLDGDPPTVADRDHVAACSACARAAAGIPALEARIGRAAGELALAGPIPSGILDRHIVDVPLAPAAPRIAVARMGLLGAAVAAAALVTAFGLGLVRPAGNHGGFDTSVAGITARLEASGVRCVAATLDKSDMPPLIGESCGMSKTPTLDRHASVYENAGGEIWTIAKVTIQDRHADAEVSAATTFLLATLHAAIPEAEAAAKADALVTEMLTDRLLPRDARIPIGDRVVSLEGSWSQGWLLRIGPS